MSDNNNENDIVKDTTVYGSIMNPYAVATNNPNKINYGTLAPVFGVNGGDIDHSQGIGNIKQPDYLYYDQRGRGIFERTNCLFIFIYIIFIFFAFIFFC